MKQRTKKRTVHGIEHFLSELLFLSLLVCPCAIGLAALIGITSWVIAGVTGGLWASGITLGATMLLGPIYILHTAFLWTGHEGVL